MKTAYSWTSGILCLCLLSHLLHGRMSVHIHNHWCLFRDISHLCFAFQLWKMRKQRDDIKHYNYLTCLCLSAIKSLEMKLNFTWSVFFLNILISVYSVLMWLTLLADTFLLLNTDKSFDQTDTFYKNLHIWWETSPQCFA